MKTSSSAQPLLRSDIGFGTARARGVGVGLGKGKSKTAKRHRYVLTSTFTRSVDAIAMLTRLTARFSATRSMA